jgi:hypothetical protein
MREENLRIICEDEKLDIRESDQEDKEFGWVFEPDGKSLCSRIFGEAREGQISHFFSTVTTATRSTRV